MSDLSNQMSNDPGDLSIYDIISQRLAHPNDQQYQDQMAPADHQAFARQIMLDASSLQKPARALGLAVAIPGYELAKYLNLTPKDQYTSNPSLASIVAGYKGLVQGLGF